jgi:predicted SAM-dependent methyltransferase
MPLLQVPPGSRLHIGCGGKEIKGYVNTDGRLELSPAGFSVDILSDPLPHGRFAEIYMCHVYEHIYKDVAPRVLARIMRALQPRGTLRLSVPDLRLILQNCVETLTFGPDPDAPLFGDYRKAAHEWDRHKRCFTEEILRDDLIRAGFTHIDRWVAPPGSPIANTHDWSCYPTISLNLMAHKPAA